MGEEKAAVGQSRDDLVGIGCDDTGKLCERGCACDEEEDGCCEG